MVPCPFYILPSAFRTPNSKMDTSTIVGIFVFLLIALILSIITRPRRPRG